MDLPVEGMTYAACSARIARGLNKLDGVENANVSLASARATVVYDDDRLDGTEFEAVITMLGYQVPEVDDHEAAEARWIKTITRRLLVAAVLTVPVVAISMIPALAGHGWAWIIEMATTGTVSTAATRSRRVMVLIQRASAASWSSTSGTW